MVKIKTEKRPTLPQLIEWAWDNDIKNKEYQCDGFEDKTVIFNRMGWAEFSDKYSYDKTDFFIVEIEEEITEDTKLPKSLTIFEHNGNSYSEVHNNKNINDILKMDKKVKGSSTNTIHMVNDDGTHTLIWRDDDELVE